MQSAFMATAAASVLWIAVLRERRDAAGLAFAALVFGFGLWSLARATQATGLEHATLLVLSALAPLSSLHFAQHRLRARSGRTAILLGVPALLLALLWGGVGSERWIPGIAIAWCLGTLTFGAHTLMHVGREGSGMESPDATRLRYLGIAQAVVVAAAAVDLLAWQLDKPRSATLVAALFYLYAGYLHLARVRVKDLRQLMGNGVALTLLAAGLAGTFALLSLWVGARLDAFLFNAFVASFILLLFLEPAKARIQALMDRYFVPSRIQLERTFRPLLERLPHILTLDEFLREVLDRTESTGRLRASAIYLRDDPHVGFQQVGSFGLPPRRRVHLIRAPAWVEALESGTVLQRDELEKMVERPRPGDDVERIRALVHTVRDLDAQLIVPLRSGERLLGFWALTDENDREPFSSTEIAYFQKIAQDMARTIDNTKTFERVRARDRFAMLGEVSAGLAHEIRNPLATIRGSIALVDDPDPKAAAEIRQVMIEEIDRLDRLVDTFLNYAHPSTHRSLIPNLGELVRGWTRSLLRAKAQSRIEVDIRCPPELPPITANAHELERVVHNLVQNAVEAIEGHGRIEVEVRTATRDDVPYVEIAVRDDGPGLDPDTLERAFIPFFTTKHSGTGLGLPLCERLVRAQGGSIHLTSRPGEPTEVLVRLPVTEKPPLATSSEDAA